MQAFFVDYFVNRDYGIGYIMTAIVYLLSCVLLFRGWKRKPECFWQSLRDLVLLCGAWLVLNSIGYQINSSTWLGMAIQFVLMMVYGQLAGHLNRIERLVQQVTFFSGYILTLRISEAIGNYTDKLGWNYHGVSMTDVVMLAAMLFIVWYLRRFRTADTRMLPQMYPLLMIAICVLAVSTQLYNMIKVDPSELEDSAVRA